MRVTLRSSPWRQDMFGDFKNQGLWVHILVRQTRGRFDNVNIFILLEMKDMGWRGEVALQGHGTSEDVNHNYAPEGTGYFHWTLLCAFARKRGSEQTLKLFSVGEIPRLPQHPCDSVGSNNPQSP